MGEIEHEAARTTVFMGLAIFYYAILQPIWWIGFIQLWKQRNHPIFLKRQVTLVLVLNILGFFYLFIQKPLSFLKESVTLSDFTYATVDIIEKLGYIFGLHLSLSMYLCRAFINCFDISFAKATEEGRIILKMNCPYPPHAS